MLTVQSQIAIYTTVFLSCTSFSTVMPTLWPYLHSIDATPGFFGLVVAFYSVGEGIGALTFAPALRHATTRHVQATAMGVGVLASILFIAGRAIRPLILARWSILTARFLHGVWTGASQAVQQAYLADVVHGDKLTATVVMINAAASLGFVCGPVFGFLVALLPPVVLIPYRVVFDAITAPGYAVLLASLLCVVLYLAVFDESADRATVLLASSGKHLHHSEQTGLIETPGLDMTTPLLRDKISPSGGALLSSLVFCNIAFFAHFYGFAIQETITTPLVQRLYAWTVRDANALFIAAGVLSLAAFIVLHSLSDRIDDRILILISFAFAASGHALLIPISHALSIPRFLTGFALLSLAFPFGRASCVSLYTKLLPMPSQAIGQAILLAVGAVARIVGPFPAAVAISSSNAGVIVFSSTAAAFCLVATLQLAMFQRLQTKKTSY